MTIIWPSSENDDDYHTVLESGPWMAADHILVCHENEWRPNFYPFEASIGEAVVWVWLPNLPGECYDKVILMHFGNELGRIIRADVSTESGFRPKCDRISMEVDLNQPLKSQFHLRWCVLES